MTELTWLFALAAALAGILVSVTIWAPRRLWLKLAALVAGVAFLPVAYAASSTLLSQPKPVALEWWQASAEEATVLASIIQEGHGIYLWLALPGVPEPRAYELPWHRELAEQLQGAQREADESDSQVIMRLPFERSLEDREPKFYAMPQPAPPPKDYTDPPPAQVFEQET